MALELGPDKLRGRRRPGPTLRILIFHGYLLSGTGSNVYTARLAAALVRLGHEVHLICQERHPERLGFVDAAGDWDVEGRLRLRELRNDRDGSHGSHGSDGSAAAACTVYRPAIGSLLPVYVQDRYEGVEARVFDECGEAELQGYMEANVAAAREVVELAEPQLALAGHLVMGPAILARALGGRVPYVVKVHGSALEYTVKRSPQRFTGFAREGVAAARAILVGSRHTAESLWAALGRDWVAEHRIVERTRLGPPGVEVELFRPRDRPDAAERLRELSNRLVAGDEASAPEPAAGDAFARDQARAGGVLRLLDPERDRVVGYVGKLIVSKGVDLLVAAWPLVLGAVPQARLAIVGFGGFRGPLEEMVGRLSAGDLGAVREMARAGRALEGGRRQPLRHLLAFLDSLEGARRNEYLSACGTLAGSVLFTGRLEHEELACVLPVCEALVVPSTFPEAFGMVAAEAAACGALPIVAEHSGLAEVAATLAAAVPAPVVPWLSFPVDDGAVDAIARRIIAWLRVEPELAGRARSSLAATARGVWSWEGVARRVLAAAAGRLGELPPIPPDRGPNVCE